MGDSYFENFKKKANIKFGNKFDYSKFIYVNAKTKGIIICPIHGKFDQTPDKHINSIYGCLGCWEEKRKLIDRSYVKKDIQSKEVFLSRANKKYNDKFTYVLDNYDGITRNKIKIICPEHGEFETIPHNHLLKHNKYGCVLCANKERAKSKTKSFDDFTFKANQMYDNKYEYSQLVNNEFVNRSSKVIVKCPEHGEFIKTATKHLQGQGCFKCRVNELIKDNKLVGGYSFDLFNKKPELKTINSYLYYLEINDGEYYKIGITITDVKNRIKSLKSKYKGIIKDVKILMFKEMELFDSFKYENDLLLTYEEFRVFTYWSTELFNINILNL